MPDKDDVIISIPEPHARCDIADVLRSIADQIDGYHREGYHPRWALVPADNPDSVKSTFVRESHPGWRISAEDDGTFLVWSGDLRISEWGTKAEAEEAISLYAKTATCKHCGRSITRENGAWVDPEATGDDAVWRETCDAHDTFTAEHEPEPAVPVTYVKDGYPDTIVESEGTVTQGTARAQFPTVTDACAYLESMGWQREENVSGYEDLSRRALTAGLTDAERGAADALAKQLDNHGNRVRQEGIDRCPCGSKYWENDRCIDCGGTETEETS